MDKVVVFGGGGRVGAQIATELLRAGLEVVLVDIMPGEQLNRRAGRLLIDARLAVPASTGGLVVYGGVDALDGAQVQGILERERPQLVINYAIPITWDATKRLPNYRAVSAAGLGAFTPVQVFTPLVIAAAMARAGLDAPLMVGNLPDITIPVLAGSGHGETLASAACGAGNVGLIEAAVRQLVAREFAEPNAIGVDLVAHHIHWVAPREPGYADDAPFLLRLRRGEEDITAELDDPRAFMNRAINACYEADAGFSSTTGILASRVARALLDRSGNSYRFHLPAPEGLPGGYPATVRSGQVQLDLPRVWSRQQAVGAMQQAQQRDGIAAIGEDGTVKFEDYARDILKQELDFDLPPAMPPGDIEAVARAQISTLNRAFDAL